MIAVLLIIIALLLFFQLLVSVVNTGLVRTSIERQEEIVAEIKKLGTE